MAAELHITIPKLALLAFLVHFAQSKDPDVQSAAKPFKSVLQEPQKPK